MNRMRCIITDDEPPALLLLEKYVMQTPFLELAAKCTHALECMEYVRSGKVDLLYMDIQMPGINGIEFASTLPKDTRVIFTTAFEKYAVQGYKVDALDYLLKPFNYDEFLKASLKALDWYEGKNIQPAVSTGSEFIFVRSEYRQVKIMLDDIYCIEGQKDYVKIYIRNEDRPVMTLMSMRSLEEKLPAGKFMRIHRSYIIALDKIESVERSQVVICNMRITVADQYKNEFQEFIAKKLL